MIGNPTRESTHGSIGSVSSAPNFPPDGLQRYAGRSARRNKRPTHVGLALCLLVLAAAPQANAGAEACVELERATQTRLGITASHPQVVTRATAIPALLQVLDPVPLIALAAEITSVRASADAATREARRLEGLVAADQSAAPRELEAARAQAAAQASLLQSLQLQLRLGWGEALARMTDSELQSTLTPVASGQHALARLDALGAAATPAGRIGIAVGGRERTLESRDLGVLTVADPRLQSAGRLQLITVPSDLPLAAGQTLAAQLSGASVTALLLPDGALVRWNALNWVYVRTRDDCFARRQIGDPVPTSDGVLVARSALEAEDVVTTGAAALLATEFATALPEDDD